MNWENGKEEKPRRDPTIHRAVRRPYSTMVWRGVGGIAISKSDRNPSLPFGIGPHPRGIHRHFRDSQYLLMGTLFTTFRNLTRLFQLFRL